MSSSKAQLIASLPEAERDAIFSKMSAAEQEALIFDWDFWSRPEQRPPKFNPNSKDGKWRTWLLTAGRGFGKTKTAAEWVRGEIEAGRRRNMGLIGPNRSDVRKIMIEGPSGILAVCPPWNLPTFEPTNDRIVWPNGAMCHVFSAEEPERLRGPNLDGLWMDELCSWGNADHIKAVYEMASFCLRIKGPLGHPPAEIITTTPKPSPILRQIMKEPKTVNIGGSTFDNLDNLDESMLDFLRKKYEGTRLGRQELYGEVLDSFEGALWTPEQFELDRLPLTGGDCWRIVTGGNSGIPHLVGPKGEMIYFKRIVVSIDPAGSANRKSNETGIVTAAVGEDEQGYLLRDKSGIYSPDQWAQIAVEEYHFWDADRILAEQNYGGDMVKSTIWAQDANVPVRMLVASKGKRVRAEPVSALYEQHRVHHVGVFPKAEDQMVTWDPFGTGDSPDRLDAIVWAFQDLMLKKPARTGANQNGYRGPISIYQR